MIPIALFSLAALVAVADTTTGAPAPDAPTVTTVTSATEVRITIRGLHLPAAGSYASAAEQRVPMTWPSTGWVRGFRVDVLDSAGRILPREILHHAGVVNLDRRQLAYPIAERLVAAGGETKPFRLPGRMGVPLDEGQQLIAYFMLLNPGDADIENASLQLTFAWTPAGASARAKDAFPVFLDANWGTGLKSTFDVPPGRSETSSEVTLPMGGRMRAMSAHLHDYAQELRLEDVETGRTLVKIQPKKDHDGRIMSMPIATFPLTWGGLRLEAGRRYRVVAVYENPTCATMPGAMAFLAGPFVPDDGRRWPALDRSHPLYYLDPQVSGVAAPGAQDAHVGHGMSAGGHDDHEGHGVTLGCAGRVHSAGGGDA